MKAMVRWAISNGPALNIVICGVMIVGWLCMSRMRRETFPEFDLDMVLITVPYPGAAPQEVEEGVCQKIEEAIRGIEGVKKVTSVANEGAGNVVMELETYANPDRVLNEVRSEVDRIPSFPAEAEDPEIRLVTSRQPAIQVGVLGPDAPNDPRAERRLREVAEQVREELLLLDAVSQVEFVGARDFQIDIEISEDTLQSHGLSLQQAAEIIRRENRELPAGSIRSESQEILLRGNNRRTTGEEIAKLPLVTQRNGAVLTVGDLGTVRDEFVDTAAASSIKGQPALAISVQRTSSEDMLAMVASVKDYVATKKMPPGYRLITWGDQTVEVRNRLDLLVRNGWQGLLIVFILLIMFLEARLAFWVAMGIPFTVLATGIYLYFTGQTLNMISMFAFVMALGIVVDDAIVVGENIYAHRQMGKKTLQAAIDGTVEVMPSVAVAVATTIIAFAPLLFVSGIMGKFLAVMPAAIIAMLLFSLVESVTVLPCHLAHRDSGLFHFFGVVFYAFRWLLHLANWINRVSTTALDWFVLHVYQPVLKFSLANRSIVVASCLAITLVAVGVVLSGITPFVVFPKLDGTTLIASVNFPDGTPETVTDQWTRRLESTFWEVADRYEKELGYPVATISYRVVGSQVNQGDPAAAAQGQASGSHVGSVEVELVSSEDRDVSSEKLLQEWRTLVGRIPGAEKLSMTARSFGPAATPIEFKLVARVEHAAELEAAVELAKSKLTEFDGVFDISDDSLPGKPEYRFRVQPSAAALGVKTSDLAETVRAAYYGEEVMRVQRGRHEVKIMVRYPRKDRRALANFDEIRVRTEDGVERPFSELAEIDIERGYSEINRVNQLRSITVSADVDEARSNARQIVGQLRQEFAAELKAFPHVGVRWEGQQEQTQESLGSLFIGFGVAILAMYVLLAFEFQSYVQPLLILLIIPFGIIGAIGGHAFMGLPITLFSMFGLVALTGIVVNDSIVLIDFINSRVREGAPIKQALAEAGARRFRPVMLTTVTTIGGLMPILLEKSLQAQVLIPMATSIAFGEMFATMLVLILVPVAYSLYVDFTELTGQAANAIME